MNYQNIFRFFVCMVVFLLLAAGCSVPGMEAVSTEEATEEPITPTQTPLPTTEIPPTPTPIPATEVPPTPTEPVIVTSADTLVGNWEPLQDHKDVMYLQINSDGTCAQSFLWQTLDKYPQVECEYAFEGNDLILTAVQLNGVPECPSPTSRYQVLLISDDQIKLVLSEDTCGPRVRSTLGEYIRIP